METSKVEGKRSLMEVVEDDQEEEDDEDSGGLGFGDDDKIKKKGKRGSSAGTGGATLVSCQVENCSADMSDAKKYHRRHKVCDFHAKATIVRIAGLPQRFCQQCSRMSWHGMESNRNQ